MMQQFIGVKMVNAEPMTRKAYNDFRGWQLPAGENGDDEGFLVEYQDKQTPNTKEYEGYVSWCPKDVFELHNRPADGMNFGHALEALKAGKKIARKGWNGKDQYLFLATDAEFHTDADIGSLQDKEITVCNFICIKTTRNQIQCGWLASQSDMLSDDWIVAE
jgi:hypothetical protein